MADISMCTREDCPQKKKCHRFTAIPSPHWQSYIRIANNRMKDCDMFWNNKGYAKHEPSKLNLHSE